ncbi:MAG: gluconolaconase, partial [Polyangiales bacterium]
VSRYRPASFETEVLADGLDQLYGVAVAKSGDVIAAELGTGRVLAVRPGKQDVLASGLRDPVGVAIGPDGNVLVSESRGGRVVKVNGSKVDTLVDGLDNPQGLLVRDGQLYIVDAGLKALIAFDLETKARRTIASELPVGAPRGVTPKPLKGMPPFSGPQGPFAGITASPDGTLYVSADGDGSLLAIHPPARN